MSNSLESQDNLREEEIALKSDNLTLYVSPWGASIRGLVADETTEIITRYKGSAKVGGQGDVLIPFPGRVAGGRYKFQNIEYQMSQNDAEGPNAIHGFVRMRPWDILAQSEVSATFGVDLDGSDTPGYPFPLHIEVAYEVSPSGIQVKYAITNTGAIDAPVAAGFHPYFSVGFPSIDDAMLTLPFESYLVYDSHLIPTGAIKRTAQSNYDYTSERLISDTQFNTCFLDPIRDPDGTVAINLRSSDAGRSVRVVLGPEIGYVVLYTGDPLPDTHRRRSLAIEPMSCASDAFNHPEWGLATVKPGESLTGHWSVQYTSTL